MEKAFFFISWLHNSEAVRVSESIIQPAPNKDIRQKKYQISLKFDLYRLIQMLGVEFYRFFGSQY